MDDFRRSDAERLARLEVGLDELKTDVKRVTVTLETQAVEDRRRHEEQNKERKADRRFQVGTAFTAAALVISALATLGDKL